MISDTHHSSLSVPTLRSRIRGPYRSTRPCGDKRHAHQRVNWKRSLSVRLHIGADDRAFTLTARKDSPKARGSDGGRIRCGKLPQTDEPTGEQSAPRLLPQDTATSLHPLRTLIYRGPTIRGVLAMNGITWEGFVVHLTRRRRTS